MLRNIRRVAIARSWQPPRQQFSVLVAERDALKRELAWTRQSLDELRSALSELRAVVLVRHRAEDALRELYRERAIARARAAERDPNAMLTEHGKSDR